MLVATTSMIISSCGVGCTWTLFKVSGLAMINPSSLRIGVSILTSTHDIYIIVCHINVYIYMSYDVICMYVNLYIYVICICMCVHISLYLW